MSLQVALHHAMHYRYDRPVALGPQVVRLRPAPHCRTPIEQYALLTNPETLFINWQQDPFSNYLARCQFAGQTSELTIEVKLQARMVDINPFDFFLEPGVERFPFAYETQTHDDLQPYLKLAPAGEKLRDWLESIDRSEQATLDFLVDLNKRTSQEIAYRQRLEPGIQTPDETLQLAQGSCRDTTWLLCQALRHLGVATRFASGYLIQTELEPELEPSSPNLDDAGPSESADLHAWTEVFLPGAGWVGLDPTSGLLVGAGHLPLACTPQPTSAAPLSGRHEPCEVAFDHTMTLSRLAAESS